MTTRKRRAVESALEAKGFVRIEADHHRFIYHQSSDGKKTRFATKTSHGMREIGDSLLGLMARQCGLAKAKFIELVDCPLDREGYEDAVFPKPPSAEDG